MQLGLTGKRSERWWLAPPLVWWPSWVGNRGVAPIISVVVRQRRRRPPRLAQVREYTRRWRCRSSNLGRSSFVVFGWAVCPLVGIRRDSDSRLRPKAQKAVVGRSKTDYEM